MEVTRSATVVDRGSFARLMGQLPEDTRCGWCGRVGAGYIPDGIDTPVPLCDHGGANDDGCFFGARDRQQVMHDAVSVALCLQRGAQVIHQMWTTNLVVIVKFL